VKETAMKRTLTSLASLVAFAGLLAFPALGQRGPGKPGAGPQVDPSTVTNVTGDVVRFTGGPGQGRPTLVLSVDGKEQSYALGSYRYLAAQKFSPAAGDRLHLTLWACPACPQGNVVAEIQNVRTGDVLKLRAADGSPLFAGPMGGHGMHRGMGPMDGSGPNPDCPYRSGD
jgi:hypothetical protein